MREAAVRRALPVAATIFVAVGTRAYSLIREGARSRTSDVGNDIPITYDALKPAWTFMTVPRGWSILRCRSTMTSAGT